MLPPDQANCSVCKRLLPITAFNKDSSRRLGVCSRCKDCAKQYCIDNRERMVANARAWQRAHPERHRATTDRWQERNPEKVRAYRRMKDANRRAKERAAREARLAAGLFLGNKLTKHHSIRRSQCDPIVRDRPGCVYIIGVSPGHCKIGRTSDATCERRLKRFIHMSGLSLVVLYERRVPDALNAETTLHRRFKEQRSVGEWFVLTDEQFKQATDYLEEQG